jgi:hypothetical protein
MPSPRPEKSHEGVLESHKRLSPSQEARGKTQLSLVSRERLMPSLRSEKSLERVLASHKRLNPSPEVREETHLSLESWGRLSRAMTSRGQGQKAEEDEDRG